MNVLVLGSGVVGTTTAWFLAKAGHDVTVVDRQPGPGLETSFANGGQISVSHAEPWANPHAPAKILRWLGREDAPLLFRLRADAAQWRWGLRFLRECLPGRTRENIRQLVTLGLHSRATLQALRAETGIRYDHLERGILHFYTDVRELEAGIRAAAVMREHGCDVHPVSAEQCLAIEPALRHSTARIVGGTFTPSDESGNAYEFTRALAGLAATRGVRFRYGTTIERIEHAGGRVAGVRVRGADAGAETITADAYVLALGSWSPLLLRPLGVELPVYPAKGYSITVSVTAPDRAPTVSLTDDGCKLVFSRLGDALRVAGTAEFNGYDTSVNAVRCDAIVRRTAALFPGAADYANARTWAGLRPATPSNVPFIGRTRFGNLFLNTGHGTLGWTLSCGSAQAVAEIVGGRTPAVGFRFCDVR